MIPPALSRGTVDRAALRRTDDAWLADAWACAAVLVLAADGTVAVHGEEGGGGPQLVLTGAAEAPAAALRFFLGEEGGTPYFAVVGDGAGDRAGSGVGDAARDAVQVGAGRRAGLRDVGALLGDRDAGLLVAAVALANWHRTHTHCPRCGTTTVPAAGGWQRICPADGSEHYPRVDPAVIMLVHDGAERCLLGRQASWPPDRFSTLAGFVEPGESAEQAVAREVFEESGVAVEDIRYSASQPWPFPGSLMLGFTARAASADEPRLLDGELAEARWFTREELRARRAARLPPQVSISHALITAWIEEGP